VEELPRSESAHTVDWGAEIVSVPSTSPANAPPSPPGYILDQELGRGGMGVVYLAKQVKLNRTVALKLILAGAHAGEMALKRFRDEATLSARFQHPNIVQVFETGEIDGLPFMALEFCGGGSLDQALRGTPRTPAEAAKIAETLANAVHHAHSHGVLHRDLKPQNVIFTKEGQPKLMDFGLAKCLETEDTNTRSGSVLGTPSYMAPEQAEGRIRDLGPATDVYGIGAILYEMLTGRPPFRAASAVDTIMQVVHNEPVPPRQLQPILPRDLETICLKCLAKEPKNRYASAQELAQDLQRFQNGEPIKARPIGVVGKMFRWTKKHPALAMLLITLVAVLLVFSSEVFSLLRSREQELREFSIRKNASDARHVASTVLLRMQRVANAVERAAEEPELHQLLKAQDRSKLRSFAQKVEARGEIAAALAGSQVDPVASWMVLDPEGAILAVSHNEGIKDPKVPGRDYFHGAISAREAAGRPVVHLSRGYRSTNQGLNKFALSMVVESQGQRLGVLVVTLVTGATLGGKLEDGDQTVSLVLPVDNTPLKGPIPKSRPDAEYVLVVHPAYEPRQEPVKLPREQLPEFRLDFAKEFMSATREELYSSDQYRDPTGAFSPSYEGLFWAGFAQVGHTEMIVVVQKSQATVLAAERKMLRELSLWSGGTAIVGLSISFLLIIFKQRRETVQS
jgi:eukaryotic-like serine/threonine-protein kinase